MSNDNSRTSPSKGQGYQRVPEDENVHQQHLHLGKEQSSFHDDEDEDEGSSDSTDNDDDGEDVSVSFVDESRGSRAKDIFRKSSWISSSDSQENDDIVGGDITASLSASASSLHADIPPASSLQVRSQGSFSGGGGSITGGPGQSAGPSSSGMPVASSSFDFESDWDDDEDDNVAVRRYHLDFVHGDKIPLPAEFSHDSLPKRVWQSFLQLRIAARQRRAERLLTMPSESFVHKLHACLLTWCCDATDRGIILVAGLVAVWLLVGLIGQCSAAWWWMGIILFSLRVSARRTYESWVAGQKRRRRVASTSTRSEAMELATTNPQFRAPNNNIWRKTSDSEEMGIV